MTSRSSGYYRSILHLDEPLARSSLNTHARSNKANNTGPIPTSYPAYEKHKMTFRSKVFLTLELLKPNNMSISKMTLKDGQ